MWLIGSSRLGTEWFYLVGGAGKIHGLRPVLEKWDCAENKKKDKADTYAPNSEQHLQKRRGKPPGRSRIRIDGRNYLMVSFYHRPAGLATLFLLDIFPIPPP
jgi:hypothetical protein